FHNHIALLFQEFVFLVIFRNRRCVDDECLCLVSLHLFRNAIYRVIEMYSHAFARKLRCQRCGRFIVTPHAHTFLHEPTRKGTHAYAADSQKVHLIVLFNLHAISLSISSTICFVAAGLASFRILFDSIILLSLSSINFSASSTSLAAASVSRTITAASFETSAIAFFV